MNERFESMAIKAGLLTYVEASEDSPAVLLSKGPIPYWKIHDFAQLIVEECVKSVGSQGDKTNLRKLFGVEEPSNIQYPPGDSVEYIKSQYNRKLNLPEDIIGTI